MIEITCLTDLDEQIIESWIDRYGLALGEISGALAPAFHRAMAKQHLRINPEDINADPKLIVAGKYY